MAAAGWVCLSRGEHDRHHPAKTYMNGLGNVGYTVNFIRGKKFFELTNHLGNVLATVSDKKLGVAANGTIVSYTADLVSAQDYYPFGMVAPGRSYTTGTQYRYGFNGKENDKDINGQGVDYDYGFRIYDARIGKFLSVDPLAKAYPWNSPYAFAENDVVRSIDLDGLEKYVVVNSHDKYGRITRIRVESIVTIPDGKPIDQDFKVRGSNKDLTNKDIYIQHLRRGQFISDDESRNGDLTAREAMAYNTTIRNLDRSNNFDSENGIVDGENQALGSEFGLSNSKTAYSYIGGSKEGITHNYKDGETSFSNSRPGNASRHIEGASFTGGYLTSGQGTGRQNGIAVDLTVKYMMDDISRQGKEYLNNNKYNVGFVESLTITYSGGSAALNDWQRVARRLGSEYGINVLLVSDPNLEMKERNAATPGSFGYASANVTFSGVTNGNTSFAQKNGQIK